MGKTRRLTVRCEYPDTSLEPTVMSFGLSPRYGLHNTPDAHDWFIGLVWEHDEFEGQSAL